MAASGGAAGSALVFLAAFTYWPVLRVLGYSFLVGRFAGQHTLGLDNYRRLRDFRNPYASVNSDHRS